MNVNPPDNSSPAAALAEPTVAAFYARENTPYRRAARAASLTMLSWAARLTGQMSARLRRPRVQFIYLHHVFADEEQGFYRLLQELAEQVTFISYTQAVDRVLAGAIDKPYAAISFDDGLASCARAARILRELGISACFFVCPSIVGQTDPALLAAFCRDQLSFPLTSGFLSWDDLERMAAAGHEIGAHSMTHVNLAALDPSALEREICQSHALLRQRFGSELHFAWPFGRWNHMTPAARDMIFAAGFRSCASALRGCHVSGAAAAPKSLCLRRDLVLSNWPTSHVLYFMSKNAAAASIQSNQWPSDYPSAEPASPDGTERDHTGR
jgi:peptidoglycan/xylan/chitin deacetylase (PgdA/CDA1 family)